MHDIINLIKHSLPPVKTSQFSTSKHLGIGSSPWLRSCLCSTYDQWRGPHCQLDDGDPASLEALWEGVWCERYLLGTNIYKKKKYRWSWIGKRQKSNYEDLVNMAVSSGTSMAHKSVPKMACTLPPYSVTGYKLFKKRVASGKVDLCSWGRP